MRCSMNAFSAGKIFEKKTLNMLGNIKCDLSDPNRSHVDYPGVSAESHVVRRGGAGEGRDCASHK